MTKVSTSVRVTVEVNLILNEDEAAALDALAGYGVVPFLEVFYRTLGRAYLEPHEAGIRSLFDSIKSQLPSILSELRECREFFAQSKTAREKRK